MKRIFEVANLCWNRSVGSKRDMTEKYKGIETREVSDLTIRSRKMNRIGKLGKGALLVGQLIATEIGAMDPVEPDMVNLYSSSSTISSPRSFDDQLRQEIASHVKNHGKLFSLKGLEKINFFLIELCRLVDNQVVLRADNQDLQSDIHALGWDYGKLRDIASQSSKIEFINPFIMEILKKYYEDDLGLGLLNGNHYERQVTALNIIKFEASEFVITMREKLPEMTQRSLVLFQSVTQLQIHFYEFLIKYKGLMRRVELERRDFCLMLMKLCGETRKDIIFNAVLDDFPVLIAQYLKAEQNMVEYLKEDSSSDDSVSVKIAKPQKKGFWPWSKKK